MTKTEIEAVIRAQAGDEQAFNELFHLYYNQAYYLALKISKCDADAKDASQETFIQIKRSLKDLHEPKNFRKWMAQIVLSKCNKIFRKNKYPVMDPAILNALPQEERRSYMTGHGHMEKHSHKEIVLHMMMSLTYHQREILVLTYFEQMSMQEMADVLSIPKGTVKSRLVSAKMALKKQVEGFESRNGLKMHSSILPILLILAGRKEYLAITGIKPKFSFASLATTQPIIALVPIVGLLTTSLMVVGASYMQTKPSQTTMYPLIQNQQMSPDEDYFVHEGSQYSQRDIYFYLRDWAHCHIELEAKTTQEYANIMPYYNFLKQQNSHYFNKLKSFGWVEAFELQKK